MFRFECVECPVYQQQARKGLAHPFKRNLRQAITELIQAKTSAGRRSVYIRSLSHYLDRFAKQREDAPLCAITTADIETYLAQFQGNSRATHLNRISTLFAFTVKRGWITANPCDRIERMSIDRRSPRILTPEEVGKVLRAAGPLCRPYFVFAVYCGIRPTEITRLTWGDVSFEQKHVVVSAAASKVRQRRIVPIPDAALPWLDLYKKETGKVAPGATTIRRRIRRMRSLLGWWQADCLRHTAASYLLAHHQDAGKVATWLGNSSRILLTHYNGLASETAARAFFEA